MDNLEQIDRDYIFNTYARDYTHFSYGIGAKLYTSDGREFIDFTSGIGVNSLGHNNKKLVETISHQASKMLHISNLFLIESQAKLAKRLVLLSGYDMKVFFSNSGLEANECAIKIARLYGEKTKRYKIITLQNSFHGRSIATLAASAQDKLHKHFAPFPSGFLYASDISNAIEIAKQDKEVVGIMLELIQGEGGIYAMPKDSIKSLERFCKENDVLLMIDEIQSGIYRSGELLASQVYDIKPDIISLAKGLAGGVPVGATMSSKKNIFEAGDHGSTFGGNPLSTSAALCVLDVLEKYKNSGRLDKMIAVFDNHLKSISKEFNGIIKDISGIGFMRGLKIRDDETLGNIVKKAREHNLLVLKSGNSTLRLLPPILINNDEINDGFKRLKSALESI